MIANLSPTEVCTAAGCPQSTLRAWRNRNRLFPRHAAGNGWTRYDMADALAVRFVVLLTARGYAAQEAVDLANAMREIFEQAVKGYAPRVGVGRAADGAGHEFKVLEKTGLVSNEIGGFVDPFVLVIDLNAIAIQLFFSLRGAVAEGGV